MHYHSGQTAAKKRNAATLNSAAHIKQKNSVSSVVGKNDTRAIYIASSESCQPNRVCSALEQGRKKVYSRTTTKYPSIRNIPSDVCYDDIKHY